MYAILVTWSFECYSYIVVYVGGSGICMHTDLMLLYLLYLQVMISMKKKSWTKVLSISLPSSFWGHPGLAKHCTVWVTFSRYFLYIRCLFTGLCNLDSKCLYIYVSAASQPLDGKSPQQLDCRENWIYAYRSTSFSRTTILAVYRFMNTTSAEC